MKNSNKTISRDVGTFYGTILRQLNWKSNPMVGSAQPNWSTSTMCIRVYTFSHIREIIPYTIIRLS